MTATESHADDPMNVEVVEAPAHPPMWRTLLPWVIAIALLIVLPYVFSSRSSLAVLALIGINVVFALSYNMLLGQGGMLSFGHAVAFGLGAYATIHLMVAIDKSGLFFPMFAVPVAGFGFGLLVGFIIGWPICQRGGTPFAMITLGIGELVAAASLMFVSFFGGEEGIKADRMTGPSLFGLSLGPPIEVYWFIAFWTLVGALAMWAFTRTPLGRLSNAVRDNPDRVRFVGYDPSRIRHLVFTASSGFAGLAGGMMAVNTEIVTPTVFSAAVSGAVLLMAFIGGLGVFYGPIIGAALITVMQSMLSDYSEAWQFYVGLLFIIVVLAAPGGIAGLIEKVRIAGQRGEAGRVAPVWIAQTLAAAVLIAGIVFLVELAFAATDHRSALQPVFSALRLPLPWVLGWIVPLAIGIAMIVAGATLYRAAPRLLGGEGGAPQLRGRPA